MISIHGIADIPEIQAGTVSNERERIGIHPALGLATHLLGGPAAKPLGVEGRGRHVAGVAHEGYQAAFGQRSGQERCSHRTVRFLDNEEAFVAPETSHRALQDHRPHRAKPKLAVGLAHYLTSAPPVCSPPIVEFAEQCPDQGLLPALKVGQRLKHGGEPGRAAPAGAKYPDNVLWPDTSHLRTATIAVRLHPQPLQLSLVIIQSLLKPFQPLILLSYLLVGKLQFLVSAGPGEILLLFSY